MLVAHTRRVSRPTRLMAAAVIGAAVAVAGCTTGGSTPSPGPASSTLSADDCPGGGASTAHDLLLNEITTALQKHDQNALVGLAGSADAKAAMESWWDNLNSIGFTTGGAALVLGSSADEPTELTARIGVHNKLDPTSTANKGGEKTDNVIATDYVLTVRPGADACHLQVTRWVSATHAPWDSGKPLYVVHTAHTVVAGDAAMKAQVDRIAPEAEHAAAWLHTFFHHNQRDEMVEQAGHVVFVAADSAEVEQWFRASSAAKPKGWVADPSNIGGLAFPLPGVTLPMSLPKGAVKPQPISEGTGGARTLISPAGEHGNTTDAEGILVHEFTHDLLANDNIGYYLGGTGAPASTVEGAARLVEAYFHDSPNDATGRNGKRLLAGPLPRAVHQAPSRPVRRATADRCRDLRESRPGRLLLLAERQRVRLRRCRKDHRRAAGGQVRLPQRRGSAERRAEEQEGRHVRVLELQRTAAELGASGPVDVRALNPGRSAFAMRPQVGDHPIPVAVERGVARGLDEQIVTPPAVLQDDHQQAHDQQECHESGHGRNHALIRFPPPLANMTL